MDLSLNFADTKPDLGELSELLTEYYAQIQERLMNVGGPRLSIQSEVESSLDAVDKFLPPNGAILLVRDSSGFLLGCGFMRMIDPHRAELKRLQRELDTTFFYVTNDQVEAMTMADRIAVLKNPLGRRIPQASW